MSTSIRNISVAIDGTKSSGFCIELDGTRWRLDNFMLSQSLLSPNTLSFSLHKEPDERINEVSFNVCGAIIGKEVLISLETESVEKESLKADTDSVADIEFAGVIIGASELSKEQVAQVQNIISREMNAKIENIHIANK